MLSSGMPIAHLRLFQVPNSDDQNIPNHSYYEGKDPLVDPDLFGEWQPKSGTPDDNEK
jgi:hypothetical protein